MLVYEIVKDLLLRETGIDVAERTRKREVIELRSLYFIIVKTIKPLATYSGMGKAVGVNHATVMHAINMYNVYEVYNKELDRLKGVIIARYGREHKFYSIDSLDAEINRLETLLNELKANREKIAMDKEKNSKKDLVV